MLGICSVSIGGLKGENFVNDWPEKQRITIFSFEEKLRGGARTQWKIIGLDPGVEPGRKKKIKAGEKRN